MKGAENPEKSGLRAARALRAEHRIIAAYEVTSMARFALRAGTFASPLIRSFAALVAGVLCLFVLEQAAHAQGNTIGGGPTAGVAVDADGVLRRVMANDPTGQLARQRATEALLKLNPDVAKRSPLRKVSLTRLEKVLKERLASGQPIDDTMLHLAGLTRLEYVFCYPESGDVVIAGPAEAWGEAPSGRMQGIESGRPVLELQDLVVALRCFPPGTTNKKPFIFCSIDPTEEGLSKMHQFLRELGGQIGDPRKNPGQDQFIANGLRDRLGMQIITVGGISPKTHFAQVMVEADYRMKLIGIGLETPPVHLTSYVDRAKPSQIAGNALQRWYFVPNYQCVRVSEDSLAMQLEGEGVKLVGEDEVVKKDGSRAKSGGRINQASDSFVKAFTKVYPKLAEAAPVYAQLRNCVDLAVAAAFIQHQDYYDLAKWKPETFNSEKAIPVETLNPPQQVETAVNALWRGNTLVTPIGGGVEMRPSQAVEATNLLEDEKEKVKEARTAIDLSKLAPGQWWWD
jgi:hypothetical protein